MLKSCQKVAAQLSGAWTHPEEIKAKLEHASVGGEERSGVLKAHADALQPARMNCRMFFQNDRRFDLCKSNASFFDVPFR